ncbi:MAG TPA: VTT domain-containing protein [Terriglobales bacterium]
METLKHILSRYTAFLWALLQPLGIWGVFIIVAIDAAAFGLPMDVVVAGYVYNHRSEFLLYVLLASAGSALGSSVLYLVGYLGGEKVLRKRMSPERFAKIHRSFERHEFWALMFPAMLPPPTPFKLFVLSAAVFEMNYGHFLLAIFAGRFVRFFTLSVLTIKFGPQFVSVSGKLFSEHFAWVLAAAALGLALWWWRIRRRRALARNSTGNVAQTETEAN